MKRTVHIFNVIVIIACMLGCSHVQTDTFPAPSWNPPALSNPIVESRQHVTVQPLYPLYTCRAGLLLFRSPPQFPEVSYLVTRIFYRQLLKTRPFLELRYLSEPFSTLCEAVRQGQMHKLDVLVLGEVPYFLDGGGMGKSGLQVDLRVVEVKTGRLLWYLSDAISATERPIVDLIVTETRPRPTPSITTLAGQLADRMCQTLRNGTYGSQNVAKD